MGKKGEKQGDAYAKGWEKGVDFALHVIQVHGNTDDAMAALRMELLKAKRLRNAATQNIRLKMEKT